MSVLVKGMEMPTCCCGCPCFNDEYCYCQAADKDLGSILIDHRHPDCPLVPVPPHGRLIDADALMNDGWTLHKFSVWQGGCAVHEMPLDNPNVPIVIPADKDGET